MIQKIGFGYDVHRFKEGRKLFLGGVEIPYARGLDGHSDADVLLHAVCDALLGAIGRGDIGDHFPPNDEAFKDISSLILLERVTDMVKEAGYEVENVDSVIIAEEPHITEFKSKMKFNIAYRLAVDESVVNIKATTQEGLGFVGAKEGIIAQAVVLLSKPN